MCWAFDPIGLPHTFLETDATPLGEGIHGYILNQGDLVDVTVAGGDPSQAFTAGALLSTAADLGMFFRTLHTSDLLSAGALEEMHDTVANVGYGLGEFTAPLYEDALWGHNGVFLGFSSMAMATLDGKSSIAIIANTSGTGANASDVIQDVVDPLAALL